MPAEKTNCKKVIFSQTICVLESLFISMFFEMQNSCKKGPKLRMFLSVYLHFTATGATTLSGSKQTLASVIRVRLSKRTQKNGSLLFKFSQIGTVIISLVDFVIIFY